MKIIDVHNHLGLSLDGGNGRIEELLSNMKEYHISQAIIFATDEKDRGVTFEGPNTRIFEVVKKHPKKLIAFVRVIPSAGQMAIDEFKRGIKLGARGLKLKASDGFDIESSKSILDLIPKKNHFPVLIHTAHNEHSQPGHWEKVISVYPHINFILGHGGKDHYKKCSEVAKTHKNVFVETSTLSLHRTRRIYQMVGAEKMLFATDYPYSHPEIELKKYQLIVQNKNELQMILHDNALRIFGME